MPTLIRQMNGRDFCFVGQLVYEAPREAQKADALQGTGVRLYVEAETGRHFLCIDCAETGEEAWYEVDRVQLVPMDHESDVREVRPRAISPEEEGPGCL